MSLRLISRCSRLIRWLNDVTPVSLQRKPSVKITKYRMGTTYKFAATDKVRTVPGIPLNHEIWFSFLT
jgi:hypothetical protein